MTPTGLIGNAVSTYVFSFSKGMSLESMTDFDLKDSVCFGQIRFNLLPA